MSGKNQREFQKLVQKYLDGMATPDEQDVLDRYYLLFRDEPANTSLLSDEQLSLLEQRLENGLFGRIRPSVRVRRLWPRIAVAASIALAISIGGYFYYNNQHSKIQQTPTYVADIAPGKLGATLTLANGKKIRLSDAAKGQLAREAGVSISKTADGQVIYEVKTLSGGDVENNLGAINTLTTAKGETYILTLPDKSKVWINAASSLTYAASLIEGGKRIVKLEGEAYFEVFKDKKHPFIVKTDKQEVEVLGTHFNINNYSDEPVTKTTLAEGSVKITNYLTVKVLKPGQQAISNGAGFTIEQANLEEELAWKNGYFRFNAEKIESIMSKISRWYNIEVAYQGIMPTNGLYGKVSRSKNISQVLTVLELTKLVHFKIEGRKVLVIAN